jgi:peptide/nickel transport system substrate-binding protein
MMTGAALAASPVAHRFNPYAARSALAFAPAESVRSFQPSNATSLVIATNRTPTDLDTHSAYDAGSRTVLNGLFETLIRVKLGTTNQYEPAIAKSWESNTDQSVWTFHLRDGVRFQDGSACDAEAVRLSFERLLALGRGPSSVIGRFVPRADHISTPDGQTVVFSLGKAAPLFEATISSATVSAIVNAKLAKQHEVDGDWGNGWAQSATDGLGTGPYRITRFDLENGIRLESFMDYWGGWEGSHFDEVNLRIVPEAATRRDLVEQGDADIVDNLPPETLDPLAANPDLVVDLRYDLAVRYIMFNTTGPLKSPEARQAMSYLFPYDDVINGVYDSHAKRAIGPCAELLRGFAPETFAFKTDIGKAKTLLDQAGVAPNTSLSIVLPTGVQLYDSIAQLFGANLEQAGLKLDIQTVDFATLVAIYYGDMPEEERPNLMPTFWSPDYDDGWNHLWPQVATDAWRFGNSGHYSNAAVDQLLTIAKDTPDESTYDNALQQIQEIVTKDDPAAIYYAQAQWPTVLRNDIGGFTPNLVSAEIYDFYALFRQSS